MLNDAKEKVKNADKSFTKIFKYFKQYRLSLVMVLIFSIISTVFTVLAPFVIGKITTTLFASVGDGHFYWEKIISLLVILISLYLVSQLFAFFQGFTMAKITSNVVRNLRTDINNKMHLLKLDYYDKRTHGEILSAVTNDVDTINGAIANNLTAIVTQVITAIGILIMMLSISPALTIIPILMLPLVFLSSAGIMKKGEKHYNQQQNYLGELNGYIEEMYNGQAVVQTFNYEDRSKEQFMELNDKLRESGRKAETTTGAISPITEMLNNIGYSICAGIGCLKVVAGKMPIGNVQAMIEYTYEFAEPFTEIANMAGTFSAANAACKRIFNLLDAEEEIPDAANVIVPENRSGKVEFRHVKFGYSPDNILMNDINLNIEPGQKVAIVGPTGAGKTTLINLLMRFYEINSGEILVDGENIQNISRNELRDRFGMVLQDTWLYEGTIGDNIAYAEDNMPKEKIINSAKLACAHNFIQTMPNGYNMILSKGAENISQGERQLITIARAIASDPEIMILDEATSNVDTRTESLIQKGMYQLMKDRTSFVIAHRLSTIIDADIILYMEDGTIKEVGNHKSLMAQNGKYAALYNSQFA